MRRVWAVAAVLATMAVLVAAARGGSSDPQLRVSAAASLHSAFTKYAAAAFPDEQVHQSFAGSDQLAAQIEQGARPDVFASANTRYPAKLYAKGLVEKPVLFARNRLVLATPAGSSIHSLTDAARPGASIVLGDPDVPVGSYTRRVLGRLPAAERTSILDNVRSQEPDVSSIAGKLTEGAADAGFVYITDVRASGGAIRAIPLPASLQPDVAYGIAVVSGTPDRDLATRFVHGLIANGSGARALRAAGFLPRP
ncbi:MAG: molybdate ABC transporter substrate-binding protein [Solirubrobacterales bacterium]